MVDDRPALDAIPLVLEHTEIARLAKTRLRIFDHLLLILPRIWAPEVGEQQDKVMSILES